MTTAQRATEQAARTYRDVVGYTVPDVTIRWAEMAATNALANYGGPDDGMAHEVAYDAAFKHILAECGE